MARTKKTSPSEKQANKELSQHRKSKIAEFWETRYVPGQIVDKRAVLK